MLGLDPARRPVDAAHFLYDTARSFPLRIGLMLSSAWLAPPWTWPRSGLPRGTGLLLGLVLAVVLGDVTPFASCSSIALIGFVPAGIPLSVTLTFLVVLHS